MTDPGCTVNTLSIFVVLTGVLTDNGNAPWWVVLVCVATSAAIWITGSVIADRQDKK